MVENYEKVRMVTPYKFNCWCEPTYENPRGFSVWFVFAKFGA